MKTKEPTQTRSGTERGSGASPFRILLIEDDPINQDVAVGMLTAMGHVVNVAGDAGAGVAMAAQGGYDAVLMDVGLPDDDGLQATARIRALPGAPGQVPVIAMTAKAMSGDREMCLEAGMTDYIAKPVLRAELAAALERCQAKGAPA